MNATTSAGSEGMNPQALSVDNAARVLSAAGRRVISPDMIREDLAAGAPTNPDGTINLVHYTAWLAKNVAQK